MSHLKTSDASPRIKRLISSRQRHQGNGPNCLFYSRVKRLAFEGFIKVSKLSFSVTKRVIHCLLNSSS